jgi:hypothetical protein
MAAPNLKNITSVFAKTTTLNVTTSATAILENQSSSNKMLKVSSITVSNIGLNSATCTLDFLRSSNSTRIAKDLEVPVGGTVVLVSRPSTIYLEEGDSLRLVASANSTLEAICSYDEVT